MDTHCHLDLYPDPKNLISEINRRQMTIFSVTTTPSAYSQTRKLAQSSELIFTGIGLHPQIVGQRYHEFEKMGQYIRAADFVGEIGLDGGPEYKQSWAKQLSVFQKTLHLSENLGGKVLSIHSRRAANEVIHELKQSGRQNTPILHWFSGSKRQANEAIQIGCWFSVGPAMLSGAKGKSLTKEFPINRLLLETDGPFTQRDKAPYMPWDASDICIPILSEIYDISAVDISKQLTKNLEEIVAKIKKGQRRLQAE